MLKSILKIFVIFFILLCILSVYVQATDINMNLSNTAQNSIDNSVNTNSVDDTEMLNTQYSDPTVTSSLPEAELGLGNILNILLIVVGVLLILLGIAIIIRLKK